jgi:hypothetical protein
VVCGQISSPVLKKPFLFAIINAIYYPKIKEEKQRITGGKSG